MAELLLGSGFNDTAILRMPVGQPKAAGLTDVIAPQEDVFVKRVTAFAGDLARATALRALS
jgi:hypothetical protein